VIVSDRSFALIVQGSGPDPCPFPLKVASAREAVICGRHGQMRWDSSALDRPGDVGHSRQPRQQSCPSSKDLPLCHWIFPDSGTLSLDLPQPNVSVSQSRPLHRSSDEGLSPRCANPNIRRGGGRLDHLPLRHAHPRYNCQLLL